MSSDGIKCLVYLFVCYVLCRSFDWVSFHSSVEIVVSVDLMLTVFFWFWLLSDIHSVWMLSICVGITGVFPCEPYVFDCRH